LEERFQSAQKGEKLTVAGERMFSPNSTAAADLVVNNQGDSQCSESVRIWALNGLFPAELDLGQSIAVSGFASSRLPP
jgi:hypothetical protein